MSPAAPSGSTPLPETSRDGLARHGAQPYWNPMASLSPVRLRPTHGLSSMAGIAAGLLLVTLVAAATTYLAVFAAPLAVVLIVMTFGALALCLLLVAPAPSLAVERLGFHVLLGYVVLTVIWPRYAGLPLPGLPLLPLGRLALLVLLCVVTYLFVGRRSFRARLLARIARFRVVFYPLLALLLWKLLGLPFSVAPLYSTRGWLNELLSVYVPMLAALGLVASRRDLHKLFATFLLSACMVVAVALVEMVVGHNLFLNILKIDSEYLAEMLLDKTRNGVNRVQATFSHPLTLSEFLVFTTPLAFWWALQRGVRWLRLAVLLALLALFALVVVKTGSRSGIGAFVVILGALATLFLVRLALIAAEAPVSGLYLLLAFVVVAGAVLGIFLLQDILVGHSAAEKGSSYARVVMWRTGLAKAQLSPLLGYGVDTAAKVVGFVANGILTIDSYYLSVLVDGGFPALLMWVLPLLGFIVLGLRQGFLGARPDMVCIMLVAVVIGFALVKSVLSLPHNHGLFMLLCSAMLLSPELAPAATAGRAVAPAARQPSGAA